jgi:hypothetical protein
VGSPSSTGRFVAFQSVAGNLAPVGGRGADVFVRDTRSADTRCVSAAASGATPNGDSVTPSISGDGRLIAFASNASNLIGVDTNGAWDVFVRAPGHLGFGQRVHVRNGRQRRLEIPGSERQWPPSGFRVLGIDPSTAMPQAVTMYSSAIWRAVSPFG